MIKFKNDIKANALLSDSSPIQIVAKTMVDLGDKATLVSQVGRSINADTKIVRRQRKSLHQDEEEPTERSLIPNQFFEAFQYTARNDEFLLHDDGFGREDRIVLFAAKRSLIRVLSTARYWCVSISISILFTFSSFFRMGDGTFDCVPKLFCQLYTIHALEEKQSLPIVYALLPNKEAATYVRMFTLLIDSCGSAHPDYFISDYESGIIAAVKVALPSTRHLGCFYHFKAALIKNISAKKLQQQFADPTLAHQMRKCAALAFLPTIELVERGWASIVASSSQEIELFLEYFESQWIGTIKLGTRKPTVPFSMWSFYHQIMEGIPLTTNGIEGWHHKLDHLLNRNSKSLFNLLDSLKLDQATNDDFLDKYFTGVRTAASSLDNRSFTARITTLVQEFNDTTSIENYLDQVATLMINVS